MTAVSGSVTVGVDIGTTSVKAVAVDERGEVLSRVRVANQMVTPGAELLEHDAAKAWRRGPVQAVAEILATVPTPAGLCVASMVPSLTVVDERGIPRSPGLLYGDARGRTPSPTGGPGGGPSGAPGGAAGGAESWSIRPGGGAPRRETLFSGSGSGAGRPGGSGSGGGRPGGSGSATVSSTMPDAEGFLRWAAREHPGAHGYWPAQAVANYALGKVPAIDTAMGMSQGSLLHMGRWDLEVLRRIGVAEEQLPVMVQLGAPAGKVTGVGTVLAGGTVDALCDQIVSGIAEPGDVLVICGATLVVWAVGTDWVEIPGLWTVPHTVGGRVLVGGPSNAGALFVDWARSLLRDHGTPPRKEDPERVPVWGPYIRGERAPFHDTSLRAAVIDLDITHDARALERGAYEASGFVVRRMLDLAGIGGRRIVASGGGTRNAAWMQALADASGLAVDVVAVHEGAALGAAFIARMAAGLEDSLDGAMRWARVGHRYDPDARWAAAATERYKRFVSLGPGV